MAYFVYILKSMKDGKHYIGSSADVNARLLYHNQGKQRSTKNRIPFVLIHTEEFTTKTEAKSREREIKSYKGGNAFKKLIEGCSPA
jgi:putative endonuclease